MDEIQLLFDEVDNFPFPDTMKMVKGEIGGLAFFPGGKGTFENGNIISDKDIMILGQDFDGEDNFDVSRRNGKEDIKKSPTWRNLLKVLDEVNISPDNCFFTNAIMGVRAGSLGTGKSPAFRDSGFIKECQDFFLYQIEIQKPKAIFILGKFTAQFLAPIAKNEKLKCWTRIENFKTIDQQGFQIKKDVVFNNDVISNLVLLTHPSFRPVNVLRRKYNGENGHNAEINMIKAVL